MRREELEEIIREEGDKKEGVYRGYNYLILRMGPVEKRFHLNGYVEIPEDHILYNVEYNDEEYDIRVHGGLTFSGKIGCNTSSFYYGFDTAHFNDISHWGELTGLNSIYRNMAYVQHECEELIDQLIDIDVAKKHNAHIQRQLHRRWWK
jgi:hypothetical protein